VLAHWRPDQQVAVGARDVMRRNPWGGLAGCVYLGHAEGDVDGSPSHYVGGVRSAARRLCALPAFAGRTVRDAPHPLDGEPRPGDAVDDSRWMVPPALGALLQPLDGLRQPSGARYQRYCRRVGARRATRTDSGRRRSRQSRRRRRCRGRGRTVGRADHRSRRCRRWRRRPAACYTGRHDVCRALGIRRQEDQDAPLGHRLLEGAMVRMAAVAVIDVRAAGSKRSPVRCRRARGRRSTAPAATPLAIGVCRIRSSTVPMRC
jgi:hypothetical protein